MRSLIQTPGETALFGGSCWMTWLHGLQFENPCVWRSPQWKPKYIYNIYIYTHIYLYDIYIYSRQVSITLVLTASHFSCGTAPVRTPQHWRGNSLGQRIPGDFCQRLTGIHSRQLWDLRSKWATSSMNIFGVLLFTSLDIFWSTCCYVGPKTKSTGTVFRSTILAQKNRVMKRSGRVYTVMTSRCRHHPKLKTKH